METSLLHLRSNDGTKSVKTSVFKSKNKYGAHTIQDNPQSSHHWVKNVSNWIGTIWILFTLHTEHSRHLPQLSPPRHTRSKPFAKVTLDWTLRLQSQHSIFSCTSFSLSVWRPPASWGLKVRSHYSSGDGGGGKRQRCASKQNSQLSAVITMLECADRLASSALWHRGMMAGRLF